MTPASGLPFALAMALFVTGAAASPRVLGTPEVVFDWAEDRCEKWDIPDAPARAWRDAGGGLRLVAGSDQSRASAGPDLESLVRDCAVLHRGAKSDDPAAFDDRAWIAAVFPRADGRIEALAHVEYHGHLRTDRCAAADYARCWGNTITALVSTDGGASFARPPDGGLVAALPYPYDGTHGRRAGYFNPSNILRDGDHLYVFVFAEAYRAQRRGACLLRRPIDGTAADWRAWDGAGFTVRFADPYRTAIADPAAHVCTPLPGLRSTVASVVRHGPSGTYFAVTPTTRPGPDGVKQSGIYWTSSPDLIRWSEPVLLAEMPLLWRRDCAAPAAFAYPSLIDPDSGTPALDTVDDDFWLYFTKMPLTAGCRIGPRRNLLRQRVSLRPV